MKLANKRGAMIGWLMSFGVFNLGGGGVILVLILFRSKKLPTLDKCFEVIPSFWRAKRTTKKQAKPPNPEIPQKPTHHPILMAITFVLGTVCVGLVL